MKVREGGPPRRRSPWVLFLFLVLLVGVGLGAWKYFGQGAKKVELEEAKVQRGELTSLVSATGILEATKTVTVGSQVSGQVRSLLVDFNSPVKQGQTLLVLDPSEFEARLAQATASLESATAAEQNAVAQGMSAEAEVAQARAGVVTAQANLDQTLAQVKSAEASVANGEASVRRARAEMENALSESKRFEELRRRDLVAQSEADSKRTSWRVSEAAYETALAGRQEAAAQHRQALSRVEGSRSELHAAGTRLAAAQGRRSAAAAQVRAAQAQVRQASASVEQARVDLQRTVIRSPIDGVVIQRNVDVGLTVAAAFQAPELLKIAGDLHRMQVRADIAEADIGRVDLGDPVEFKVDAYPDRRFKGRITQVRPAPVESKTGTATNVVVYGVLVDAPNPELLLKPGMTATVEVSVEQRKDVLLVPNQALRFIPPDLEEEDQEPEKDRNARKRDRQGRPGTVWIPGPDGKPKKLDLRIGITDGERSEILDGDLKEGQVVYLDVKETDDAKSSQGGRRRRMMF